MRALLCLLPLLAGAGRAELAPEARAHYDAGRFSEAAAGYEALLRASPDEPALHYDLGNALYKAGRLGPALASYERAFALDPRDGDVRHNLEFALRRAGEDFAPPGLPPALFAALTALSERERAGLFWLAAWAALLLGSWALLDAARRDGLARAAGGCALASALLGVWTLGLRAVLPAERGVIVAARAELRHGPGASFGVAFVAPEGRRVKVLGSSGSWMQIGLLKEGAKGWIEASSIERL